MVIVLPALVPQDFADQIVADLNPLPWHAGDTFDPDYAARVKRNLELKEQDSPIVQRYAKICSRQS